MSRMHFFREMMRKACEERKTGFVEKVVIGMCISA